MFRNAGKAVFVLLIGALLLGMCRTGRAQPADKKSRLELVHADTLRYDRVGDSGIVHFIGHVFFRKGKKELRCDHAIYYRDRDVTVFKGHVVFIDSSRSLQAEIVEYHAEPEKEIARGHVHLVVDNKDIYADEVVYLVDSELAEASGDVLFEDREDRVQLYAEHVTYDRMLERGRSEQQPKLVKLDSLRRPEMTIWSRKMEYDGKEETATAVDSVKITRQDMIAFADTARYLDRDKRIEISGRPRVRQGSQDMQAHKIVLFIEDSRLKQARFIGKAAIVSHFMVNGMPAADRLYGAEIWMDVENDTLRHMRVLGQATSVYHVIDDGVVQGLNQVMGDELDLYFEAGKVKRVAIFSEPGLSQGKFFPLKFTNQRPAESF